MPDPAGMVGGAAFTPAGSRSRCGSPDARGEVRNRDFFGGSLAGVEEKLDYLQSLGVETLYFCPIFEAAENHRYGTADYERVDPMLGSNEDFKDLCAAARARGIRVMLDGVFNHQGFVSRYFNGDGFYPELGAHQSEASPYYPWYHFNRWPDQYDAWWGIYSLPAVNESQEDYVDYIIEGEDSIVRRWLRAGADGWRLDVADELPDAFIEKLHRAAREAKPEAVIIGEGVGGRVQQNRLWRPPQAPSGGTSGRADELPLPQCAAGLAAGRGRRAVPGEHGDHSGELSARCLLFRHELPGHP
ncbi:MAG: alpha-amylase family glycosyl hydrolase [Intestinimonas sp.]